MFGRGNHPRRLPPLCVFPFRVVIPVFPKRFRTFFLLRSTDRSSSASSSHLVFSKVSSGHHQHPWFSHGARSTRAVFVVHVFRCFVNHVVVLIPSLGMETHTKKDETQIHPYQKGNHPGIKRNTRTRRSLHRHQSGPWTRPYHPSRPPTKTVHRHTSTARDDRNNVENGSIQTPRAR